MLRGFISANRKCATWLERKFPGVFLSPSYKTELENRIWHDIDKLHPSIILEVGGIDRPLLTKRPDYRYVGLDIEEQPDCYRVYDHFIVQTMRSQLISQSAW